MTASMHFIVVCLTQREQISIKLTPAFMWLKYCRYGAKPYSINQSINQSTSNSNRL